MAKNDALFKQVNKRATEIREKGGKKTIKKEVFNISRADALKQASKELNPNKEAKAAKRAQALKEARAAKKAQTATVKK